MDMASGCSAAEQAACFDLLRSREVGGGGFAETPGGEYRPDATAWGTVALDSVDACAADLHAARERLVAGQQEDGRISLAPGHPEAFWPTAPAILALAHEEGLRGARERAIDFLLATAGEVWPIDPSSPLGHDTSLRGWSWVDGTHSWVEPTALSLLALRETGETRHPRYIEGFNLLLNRQLPSGGWNYGNTVGFGQELRPMVDATGLALAALAGSTSIEGVDRSVKYLQGRAMAVHAPFSLAWALIGLTAWRARPANASERIRESLERQPVTGEYPTSALALLLLAQHETPFFAEAEP